MAERGTALLARATSVVGVDVAIALANRDFEDWLYASAETLELGLGDFSPTKRGQHEIKEALKPDAYTKPVFQPRLASRVDLVLARGRSRSLDRMLARFDELRAALPPAST